MGIITSVLGFIIFYAVIFLIKKKAKKINIRSTSQLSDNPSAFKWPIILSSINVLAIGIIIFISMANPGHISGEEMGTAITIIVGFNIIFSFVFVAKKGFNFAQKPLSNELNSPLDTVQQLISGSIPFNINLLKSPLILKQIIAEGPNKSKIIETINQIKKIKQVKQNSDDNSADFLVVHQDGSEHWYRAQRKENKISSFTMYS